MSIPTTVEEAYLVGCLMGRGVLQRAGNRYKLIFRIPFREYDPVGTEIVNALLSQSTGLAHSQLLELSAVRARNLRNLANRLVRLRRWNPPTRVVGGSVVERVGGRWRIGDATKAREYLRRQKTLLGREHSAIKDYVLRHLTDALSTVSNQVEYSEEMLSFGITDHAIACEIEQRPFDKMRRRYGLSLGEIHRIDSLPPIIYASPRDIQEEFVRGLADIVGSFDKWFEMWRVQFSILENESFCVELCRLFQVNLEIPVHYIEWNEEYMGRGSRDILLKIWTPNAAKLTDRRVFYNYMKQTEFLENLDSTMETVATGGTPTMFNPCPRDPENLRKYTIRCMTCGCTQI